MNSIAITPEELAKLIKDGVVGYQTKPESELGVAPPRSDYKAYMRWYRAKRRREGKPS